LCPFIDRDAVVKHRLLPFDSNAHLLLTITITRELFTFFFAIIVSVSWKYFCRTVYKCKEVLDNTVTVIRNALSATPIDKDRLVVGTEEGLYTVDLDRDGEGICLHPHFCALQGWGSVFFLHIQI
jgi:hypothetical protein